MLKEFKHHIYALEIIRDGGKKKRTKFEFSVQGVENKEIIILFASGVPVSGHETVSDSQGRQTGVSKVMGELTFTVALLLSSIIVGVKQVLRWPELP